MKAPNSAGVVFSPTAPRPAKAFCTSGLSCALTITALSFSITSGGVPAGAIRPNHDDTSNLSKPDSSMVGRSGAVGERLAVVTARARSLPPFTWGHDDGMLSNMKIGRAHV